MGGLMAREFATEVHREKRILNKAIVLFDDEILPISNSDPYRVLRFIGSQKKRNVDLGLNLISCFQGEELKRHAKR